MQTSFRTNLIATSRGVHTHSYPQILIGQQGVMHCELPANSGEVARGAIGLLPCDTEHRYRGASERCQLLVIDLNVEDAFIKAFEEACTVSIESRLLSEPALLPPSPGVLNLLSWTDYQVRHLNSHTMPVLQYQLISVFLGELILQGAYTPVASLKSGRLEKARLDDYIDHHMHRLIENEELANLCHVSTSHLYVLIKQLSGLSPQQYIAARRMLKAQQLINERKFNLITIAHRVGFSDGASFSRAFRRHFGHAPSAAN
ncbi:helix-turn-helix domain-containing protein (plasmid) [Pseudomonas luteola]|uniref:AraC family transcriptional regulator n=1 Tax=Pseudomonas luteola TaxID=47886 RepID=UPI003DA05400